MTQMAQDQDFQSRMRKLDELLSQVQEISDPATRQATGAIIETLLEFHGMGLKRIFEQISEAGALGQSTIDSLSEDDLVSGLLLLHGLHPLDVDARVRQALEKVKPYLGSHGGNVDLLEISEDGIVRLRLQGSCHSCPSSQATLKNLIEQAIYDKAPEITSVLVEGIEDSTRAADRGFVPVEQLLTGRKRSSERTPS